MTVLTATEHAKKKRYAQAHSRFNEACRLLSLSMFEREPIHQCIMEVMAFKEARDKIDEELIIARKEVKKAYPLQRREEI